MTYKDFRRIYREAESLFLSGQYLEGDRMFRDLFKHRVERED
jgi:hypothetical protein